MYFRTAKHLLAQYQLTHRLLFASYFTLPPHKLHKQIDQGTFLQQNIMRFFVFMLLGSVLLALSTFSTQPVAQGAPRNQTIPTEVGYHVRTTEAGTSLEWMVEENNESTNRARQASTALEGFPTVRYEGYDLPMQIETVILPDDYSAAVELQHIDEALWPYLLSPAEPYIPPALDIEEVEIGLQGQTASLPTAPVFLLREGRVRGQRVGIIAFSPIYRGVNGTANVALTARAMIPGATPIHDLNQLIIDSSAFRANGRVNGSSYRALAPSNSVNTLQSPTIGGQGIKVVVDAVGIQGMEGAALIEAGLPLGTNLAALHLRHKGQEISLDVRDNDGLLDHESRILFYAAPSAHSMDVGDRWNAEAFYFLTLEAEAGARMTTRSATPSGGPVRRTAIQEGIWAEYKNYESTMPGVDGDYWFSEKMTVAPAIAGETGDFEVRTLVIDNGLPIATDSNEDATYKLTGSARSITEHNLQVYVGHVEESITWLNSDFYESWEHTFKTNSYPPQVDLILRPAAGPSDIRLDKFYWRIPVKLNFGFQGGRFSGVEGIWRYQLENTPAQRTLYDITTPSAPVILDVPNATNFRFKDGPEAHDYILADELALNVPQILPARSLALAQISGAHTIYIAPAEFHQALQPLVDHRRIQGYQVAVIDAQEIYDQWGHGYMSPRAIRQFLQYATTYWQLPPLSVVLVGDSTTDPHNYTGSGNPNILPTYLAHVDKWIGETACENCFAQLDGDDPLNTELDPGFLTDIWLGRFSVQTTEHLTAVVDKILRYEQATDVGIGDRWRQSSLFLADNYLFPNGAADPAGDFAYLSDIVFEGDSYLQIPPSQSVNMSVGRLYYDPSSSDSTEPWREPNAVQARLRTIEQLNKGYGLVTYNGHSNHFQWASTDRSLEKPFLFGMNDVFSLDNADRLPIILEMTCLTSQFTNISTTGTTIDERLQRHEGAGSVATWGSSGLTVAYGHDALMRGFQAQLWRSEKMQAPLGGLTQAGYLQLFARGTCCQESRYVFLLLGDPLTPARVWAAEQTYIPGVLH
ncbi:MAG: C25 family cysteine peptidase [Chloroflexota bacterium]